MICKPAEFTKCPSNIQQANDDWQCAANVSYTASVGAIPSGSTNYQFNGATTGNGSGTVSGSLFNVGNTHVTIVTNNVCGTDTCMFVVTVEDNQPPKAVANDQTVYLDANGQGSISASNVDGGSQDNCGIASVEVDPAQFDCSDVGQEQANFTVTDIHGNSSQAGISVTIFDTVAPTLVDQDITVYLDASGNTSISSSDVIDTVIDACGISGIVVAPASFDCNSPVNNVVTVSATDNNGNTTTTTANVTVLDSVAPIAITQDLTVYLDVNGGASISAAQVDNGSNDACGIAFMSVDPPMFNCDMVGPNSVTLAVSDNNGNTAIATAIVTVMDTVKPNPIAQDVTVYLDSNGNGTITVSDVNNGSDDACGIASLVIDQSSFDCSHLGPNSVTLIAADVNGNFHATSSVVTVSDTIAPVIMCTENIVVTATPDNCSPSVNWPMPQTTDNCGPLTWKSNYNPGDNFPVGVTKVTYLVKDGSGNKSRCSFKVKVKAKPFVMKAHSIKVYPGGHNVTCYGAANGKIKVGAKGGCLPYTWAWSNGDTTSKIKNLTAGSYSVVITDANGSIVTDTFELTQPDSITAVISPNATVYFGYVDSLACTTVGVSATGGLAPYVYTWSTGDTADSISVCPDITTEYIATITDSNGCQGEAYQTTCFIDVRCKPRCKPHVLSMLDASRGANHMVKKAGKMANQEKVESVTNLKKEWYSFAIPADQNLKHFVFHLIELSTS